MTKMQIYNEIYLQEAIRRRGKSAAKIAGWTMIPIGIAGLELALAIFLPTGNLGAFLRSASLLTGLGAACTAKNSYTIRLEKLRQEARELEERAEYFRADILIDEYLNRANE